MMIALARGTLKRDPAAARPATACRRPMDKHAIPVLSCLPLQLGSVPPSLPARACRGLRLARLGCCILCSICTLLQAAQG